MKILRRSDMPLMPWKNGMGTTTEVAIFPQGSSLKDGTFHWRISVAKMSAPSPFSKFDGCRRWLAVWKGRGLQVGNKSLAPMQPFAFDGAESLKGEPDGEVVDLGIVYRQDIVSVEMRAIDSAKVHVEKGRHFLFCTDAALEVVTATADNIKLNEGDALEFDSAGHRELEMKNVRGRAPHALLISIDEF